MFIGEVDAQGDPAGVGRASVSDHPLTAVVEAQALDIAAAPLDRSRSSWLPRYQAALVVVDAVATAAAVLIAYLVRFGTLDQGDGRVDAMFAFALPVVWVVIVGLNRGYEGRIVGAGPTEFQRIGRSFLHLTALVTFTSFVVHSSPSREFVLTAVATTLVLGVLGRYGARKVLHGLRVRGHAMTSVLVVGEPRAIGQFTTLMRRDRHAGLRVVGACVPTELAEDGSARRILDDANVSLLGDVDSIVAAVELSGADTVAVVSSQSLGAEKLRWISWQLEGRSTDLVVSPGLTEVAGPRLHIQPMAGLPLVHVEEPEFRGLRRFFKAVFDRSVAAVALFFLAPVLVGVAIAVRMTSDGPAFFRQVRVGRDGTPFTMVKFRSMYSDAEERLAALAASSDHGDGVLFKMRNDPRVTTVGRVLRKFSLDELPQLINVLTGSMSLVGPRPPLPSEVARYEDHVHRRFLVKPGLTGLWQISGRSNLEWDESVRLDLRYVENWSIMTDMLILWKTVRTVIWAEGAY